MTAETVIDAAVYAFVAAGWFFIGWSVRAQLEARRQRKAAETAVAAFEQATEAALRAMAARFGGFTGVRVSPADIRAGDEIHWHGPGAEPCIDYEAGFNGDVAGKTTGEWIRKDEQ